MSNDPNIGALRHRVTLEAPVTSADGAGGRNVTWSAIATLWVAIEPVSAAEVAVADRLDGRVTHRITLRHRADVVGGMRLTMDGRVFRILVAHDPDEAGRWTEILAEEEGR